MMMMIIMVMLMMVTMMTMRIEMEEGSWHQQQLGGSRPDALSSHIIGHPRQDDDDDDDYHDNGDDDEDDDHGHGHGWTATYNTLKSNLISCSDRFFIPLLKSQLYIA